MQKKSNTIIVPIISYDFIGRFIETLYKNTPPNFYLFVIDQVPYGIQPNITWEYEQVHLWIKCYRNLGFSKAHNTGIKLAQTPYITLSNDDVEFINPSWWDGIMSAFAEDHHIIAVNPMSPKEGSWGYGLRHDNKDTWQPPEGYICDREDKETIVPIGPNGKGITYKEQFSQEDYDFLLNNHPRYRKDTCVDAIAMWCTVFKKTGLDKIGLLDEKFYPGSGEDYDMNARAYSCAWPKERDTCDPEYHYRMISTTKSWVWHHWGKSKDKRTRELDNKLFKSRPSWNNNAELWPNGFDVWGHKNENDVKTPYKRIPQVFIDEL